MNLDDLRASIERALARALPDAAAPPLILEAMRYALLGGGKRLRPCLTLATAEAVALRAGRSIEHARELALPAACAIEFVHTYSLVHDDLPAMDNDILRRGRPTTHVVYGDGVAILAGDGLLTEAFLLISESPSRLLPAGAPAPAAEARVRTIQMLAAAAGAAGMVGGQTIDHAAEGRVPNVAAFALDATSLREMHARKTGALIRGAVTIGGVAAGADDATIAHLDAFARHLGLAFQIVDDVLDVEGSGAELGKTPGKDAAAGKVTYPSLYGLDRSRALAAECVANAKAELASIHLDGRLPQIAEWVATRTS